MFTFSLTTALAIAGLTSLMIAAFMFILFQSERSEEIGHSYLLLAGAYGFNGLRLGCQLLVLGGFGICNVVGDIFYLGLVSLFFLGVRSYAKREPRTKEIISLLVLFIIWVTYARASSVPFPWLALPSHVAGAAAFGISGYYLWCLHKDKSNLGHLTLALMMVLQGASTLSYPFTRNTWYAPIGFSVFAILASTIGVGFIISALKEEQANLLGEMNARRHAEEERMKYHALLEGITRNSPAAISVFDGTTGGSILLNQAVADLTGGPLEELRGMNFRTIASWREAGLDQLVEATLKDGITRHQQITLQTSYGRRLLMDSCIARFDVEGNPYLLFIFLDATERMDLQNQLNQSQKIDSIGLLAGGVAHDLNNLLTPILGYAELLKFTHPVDSNAYNKAELILQAGSKAKILTQQLLSFGRKQILEMKTVDLNKVILAFYEIMRRTIRENIELRLHLTDAAYGIKADSNQLEQILLNLAINAQDAIHGNGQVSIETLPVTLDEEHARQHAEVKPGNFVMLAVTDSGCGMDRETLSKVFEPFFTTKKPGEGTGLGLATVYGLVKQHEGHIWVYSEIGKGTVFKIYFPVVQGSPISEAVVADHHETSSTDHTILLVEDNDMVRNIAYDLLISSGYKVLVAETPEHALKINMNNAVDLLLTDVVMPVMNGPELYAELLSSNRGLKVLYMSGYTNNVIVHHGVLHEGINFIQKPFAVKDLSKKIDTILSAPSA